MEKWKSDDVTPQEQPDRPTSRHRTIFVGFVADASRISRRPSYREYSGDLLRWTVHVILHLYQ